LKKTVSLALVLTLLWGNAHAAIRNFTGFETGDAEESASTSGTVSVQATTVRTGVYALRTNPATTGSGFHDYRAHSTNGGVANINAATLYLRFYFRYATKAAANDEVIFDTFGAARKLEVRLNSSGNLVLYDNLLGLLATGTAVLNANTWYLIELVAGTGTTASIEVKVDGVSDISTTGDTTTTNHHRVRLGKVANRNGNSVDYFFDDVVYDDAALPDANAAVQVMQADSDGAYTAWTIGAGGAISDWDAVDELPSDGAITYLLSTLVINDATTVGLESAASAGISGTVNSVKPFITHQRDGAANGTIKLRTRSGGTDSDAATFNPLAGVGTHCIVHNTDPTDAAAWTLSKLDALEYGGVEGETTDRSRWQCGGVMVLYTPGAEAPAAAPARLQRPRVWIRR